MTLPLARACCALPRPTFAKHVFAVNKKVPCIRVKCLHASLKLRISCVFEVMISFSFFQDGLDLEHVAWSLSQFAQ